jgi:primary-amine oxidase
MSAVHPFDPATAEEIELATQIIENNSSGDELHFKAAGLEEPEKQLMIDYLNAEHEGTALPLVSRRIFLIWYIKRTPRLFEAIVDVTHSKLIHRRELPRDFHGPVDRVEHGEAAKAAMADARVLAEIERLNISPQSVILDTWDYGVDGKDTQDRLAQVC